MSGNLVERLEAAVSDLFDMKSPLMPTFEDLRRHVFPKMNGYLRNRFELRCTSTQTQIDRGEIMLDVWDAADGKFVGFDGVERVFNNIKNKTGNPS